MRRHARGAQFRKRTFKRPQTRELLTEKRKKTGVFRRRFSKVLQRTAVFVGIVLLIGSILGSVFFLSFFTIQEITISRKDFRVEGENIGVFAQQSFIGKNIFLVRSSNIEHTLREVFPEVATVDIERKFPHSLRLIVATFPVSFRWTCERVDKSITETGEIRETNTPVVFYVNHSGHLTYPNPDEKEAFLIYEKAPCPKDIANSKRAFKAEIVESIFTAKKELEEILGQKVIRAGYYRDAKEIHLITESETAYWIDFASPAKEQVDKLKISLALEPKLKQPLEHVDIRVPEKIFFVLKK